MVKALSADERYRAVAYPYPAPVADCVWVDGRIEPLLCAGVNDIAAALESVGADPRARRTPILAIGSNRAPSQLIRKFAGFPTPCAVLVAKASLKGFDVVFGASISGYGAVGGATLAPSPGTDVEVWATWLDDAQLAHMHETEGLSAGVYALLELQQIDLTFAAGPVWTAAEAYVQRAGALNLGGAPTAFAEVPATGRKFQALTQRQAQSALRDRFAQNRTIDQFIAENIHHKEKRMARVHTLRQSAIPFEWPHIHDVTPKSLWRG